MRKITVAHESYPIRGVFRISRGSRTHADVLTVTIQEHGIIGHGECVPYKRYGETIESVHDTIQSIVSDLANGMDLDELQNTLPAGAARNAVDCALWDLRAKLHRTPAWELAGLNPPAPIITAYTLSLDTPDAMAAAAKAVAHLPLLKLKLDGTSDDIPRVRAVRTAAPRCRLIIDANEAWSADHLADTTRAMASLGVEMIEQPLPADNDDALADINSAVPICADESCHTRGDFAALAQRYDMINIKLDKSGGLTEALAMIDLAQANELGIMVGCMVSTSLSIAPAMLVAQFASVIDLDGAILLDRDRTPGLTWHNSIIEPAPAELWG